MLAPLPGTLVLTQLVGSLRGGAREVYDFLHADGVRYHCYAHAGEDYSAAFGTPVFAMKGGVLSVTPHDPWSGGYASGLGIYAVITLPSGETHVYAHLSAVPHAPGPINAGVKFALSGDSGGVAPHLHIAVRPPKPDYANKVDGVETCCTHFDHTVTIDFSNV